MAGTSHYSRILNGNSGMKKCLQTALVVVEDFLELCLRKLLVVSKERKTYPGRKCKVSNKRGETG
jgi:hypothetical protein